MLNVIDWDNYEFRCSALGKIMSAKGDITISNVTYLQELFIGEIYGTRKEIHTKYFEKGIFCEEDGITLLQSTLHKGQLILKNKERKHNGYIHGEADCIVDDFVYDIKNAFDLFTFGKARLSTDYYWQVVGYMWLWDKPKGRVFYCLNNTPEHMLVSEERKLFYQGLFMTYESPEYIQACEELRKKHNYDHMSIYEKFKVFDVEGFEDAKKKLEAKIEKCREYLNMLQSEFNQMIERNKQLIEHHATTEITEPLNV